MRSVAFFTTLHAKHMAEQGSGGNVIAALASFFIAGLGQLLQGRLIAAAVHFVLAGAIWAVSFGTMGWVVHLYSVYDAATWSK
jgi:TM2 domain-containing membrane protein YozV